MAEQPSWETIAELARLTAPDEMWAALNKGGRYSDDNYRTGLTGINYQPEVYGCDWLIQFVRSFGIEPSIAECQRVEILCRGEDATVNIRSEASAPEQG